MCGHGIYNILTLMFDGLSAFGTVGAVIFSLYVLLDSKRIKYKIKADSVTMMGLDGTNITGINVTLTNNSKDTLIKIEMINWKIIFISNSKNNASFTSTIKFC